MDRPIRRPGTFWTLVFHSNKPTMRHIENYEIDHAIFDYQAVMRGIPFQGTIPESVRLFVYDSNDLLADHLANPLGWTVISDRLVKYLWPMISNCVQLLPAPLYDHSGTAIPGYHIVNVIKVIDCIDRQKSPKQLDRYGGFIMPTEACIDPNRTGGAHMFKFIELSGQVDSGVTCSYELVRSLEGMGFTGLACIPYAPFD